MAQYKVPQDVEADDKLLGPFSFRQFVYLMLAAALIAASVGLFQLLPLLAIIPLVPVLLLVALALPLKKDQPMETYLVALVDFYLKPRVRLWNAGQRETTIVITAPKLDSDVARIRTISGEEATHRLSFLADIVDTQGYSIKDLDNNSMRQDFAAEATTAVDMFEGSRFDSLATTIRRDEDDRHAAVVRNMQQTINAADDFMTAPLREEGLASLNPPSVTKTIATPKRQDTDAVAFLSLHPAANQAPTPQSAPAPSDPLLPETPLTPATTAKADPEIIMPDSAPIPAPAPTTEKTSASDAPASLEPSPSATQPPSEKGGESELSSAEVAPEIAPAEQPAKPEVVETDKPSSVVVMPDMEAIEAEAKAAAEGNKAPKSETKESDGEVHIDLKAAEEAEAETNEKTEDAKAKSDASADEAVEKPVENSDKDHNEDSPNPEDPSIIDLANNDVFSVATIAKEAKRVNNRKEKDEVFISLH